MRYRSSSEDSPATGQNPPDERHCGMLKGNKTSSELEKV